ncbi:hypothetical protein OIU84_010762 [Salix udensis]|uniref:RRP12 N-terminal HEAT domain-containing protein n=1 Tax=Salix udensis TaxID=889485 RepID=A0AAD6NVX7_9ROSI|nr:hypothetical protein OIU84_010762 [Salix udensis]
MTDSRINVRRQSHSCIRDTLLNLQGNAALAPASEAITKSVDSLEILCITLKANKRNRNRAYDLLVQIGHIFGDEENGGKKENLYQFFNMVAGGLALESPHDQCSNERHSLFGIRRKNSEIIKANLGLLKVLVSKSQAEGLQMFLGSMVEGLLRWQDDTINHFKAKVKHILEMLVKKCGLDAVKAVMPEEHMKLLANIRKIKERRERKHAASSEETKSHMSRATTSRSHAFSKWINSEFYALVNV